MTEQIEIFKVGNRFYYPVNFVHFQTLVSGLFDAASTIPEFIAGRPPPRESFIRWCGRKFFAYILLNNFARYNSSPYLINWDNRNTPSKLKACFSGSISSELLSIIRELARPMLYQNNLYYPNPDTSVFDTRINDNTDLNRNGLIAGPQLASLHIPWQVNVDLVCSQWLTLCGFQQEAIGLESLEAVGLSYYKNNTNEFFLGDVSDVRRKSALLLVPTSEDAANAVGWDNLLWLVQDLTRASLAPSDLSNLKFTLGLFVAIDDRDWIYNAWLAELTLNITNVHFPTLGVHLESEPANVPSLGKRVKRNRRRKRVKPPDAKDSQQADPDAPSET